MTGIRYQCCDTQPRATLKKAAVMWVYLPEHIRPPYLVSPLEDSQGVARGEGTRWVFESQHTALRVQRLVDVRMRLELEASVGACCDGHPHACILVGQHLKKCSEQGMSVRPGLGNRSLGYGV